MENVESTEVLSRKKELDKEIQKIEQAMLGSRKYQKMYLRRIAEHFHSIFGLAPVGLLHCYLNCLKWQLERRAKLGWLRLLRYLVCLR